MAHAQLATILPQPEAQKIPLSDTARGDVILEAVLRDARTVLFDRDAEMTLCIVGLLSGGHVLIEDEPGVGKTTLVKVLASLCGLVWKRVQCTNDMLPADILGGHVWNAQEQKFVFHPGPIFSELVMLDELNRASARTQSALLQAMEEREVSLDGMTRKLPAPFFLIATQNPKVSVGTVGLPESQIDRFHLCVTLGKPARATQKRLIDRECDPHFHEKTLPSSLFNAKKIAEFQQKIRKVVVSETIREYILDLMAASEKAGYPLSPRALIALTQSTRGQAWLSGRDFSIPEDVKAVFPAVTYHRIATRLDSPAPEEIRKISKDLLEQVAIP